MKSEGCLLEALLSVLLELGSYSQTNLRTMSPRQRPFSSNTYLKQKVCSFVTLYFSVFDKNVVDRFAPVSGRYRGVRRQKQRMKGVGVRGRVS